MRSLHPSEAQIQAAIVDWLTRCVRCRVAAIPNGGKRGFAAQRKVKQEGLSKGAPDIIVAYHDGSEPRTLWIEVKSKTGVLRPEQRQWRDDLQAMGHDHIVAKSLDDVRLFFCGE